MPPSRNTRPPTIQSGLVGQDRMPTRVNSACRRCRRNKSRCDRFRPCSLCLRADVDCEPADTTRPANERIRGNKTRHEPYASTEPSITSSPAVGRSLASPARRVTSLDDREASYIGDGQPHELNAPEHPGPPGTDASSMAPLCGESESAMGIVRRICRLGSQSIESHPTSAIPDGELESHSSQSPNHNRQLPISSILNCQFPGEETILDLVEDYFDTVHWFSLVVYEPHFRRRLETVQGGYAYASDTSFLLLLSVMLCMGAWYRSARSSGNDAETWRLLSNDLLQIIESRVIHIMDHHSLTAIQTCILLGSHHVYHGRPNLSFSLLGATIKMAHALNLHRNSDRMNPGDIEERRRVWWTIYTWDRFASISYGRPLSINDEDCNLPLPGTFVELPYFKQSSLETQTTSTLYSPYQVELSKLYVLASPALKMIFGTGSAKPSKQDFGRRYTLLINDVTKKLVTWHSQLPSYLSLRLDQDYQPRQSTHESRAHILQSLALQLTFDNLLIVLYRPFLSRQLERLSTMTPSSNPDVPSSNTVDFQTQSQSQDTDEINLSKGVPQGVSEHWWSAAVRTAQVTHLPQLAQLATGTHLVAFMAMNLFHSAIVLVLNALSSPLSDRSQGIKRTVTRILRLQELVGRQSTLSSQSSVILKNLIRLLLRREGEAMLGISLATPLSVESNTQQSAFIPEGSTHTTVVEALRFSVEEMQAPIRQFDYRAEPGKSDSQRLGENLASVQQVFPTLNEDWTQYNPFRRVHDTEPLQDSTANFIQGQEDPCSFGGERTGSISANDSYYDGSFPEAGGNHMFWLWHYTWDGLFNGENQP